MGLGVGPRRPHHIGIVTGDLQHTRKSFAKFLTLVVAAQLSPGNMERNGNDEIKASVKISVEQVLPVNPSQHLTEFRLLFVFQCVKDLLDAAFFDKFKESHYMLDRQAASEFLIKRVVILQMIMGFRHFEQTLGANELFTFNKTVEASPAITGIKQRDEILENSVGG